MKESVNLTEIDNREKMKSISIKLETLSVELHEIQLTTMAEQLRAMVIYINKHLGGYRT